jgi:hypothetical protein
MDGNLRASVSDRFGEITAIVPAYEIVRFGSKCQFSECNVKMMHDAIYEAAPFQETPHKVCTSRAIERNIDSPTHQHYKSQFRRTFFG